MRNITFAGFWIGVISVSSNLDKKTKATFVLVRGNNEGEVHASSSPNHDI